MSRLTACLEDFNRKERYWLMRYALGEPGRPIPLARPFRDAISLETGLDIPADAWWAMDYHIDWLFGALQSYRGKETCGAYRKDLLTGSQEDFDFVIAYATTLILIEAKATGRWRSKQHKSKFERIQRLEDALLQECGVTVRSLLLSPGRPPEGIPGRWIPLPIDGERKYFSVLKRWPDGVNPSHWQLDTVANPGYRKPRAED